MVKLRVKEPLRNERGEVVGSGNYGIYSAGEVFVLPEEEAERELAICGHAIERYEEWQGRQRIEQAKQVYTRQQAEDFARHQAELRQMSLAETELRKQAAAKRLHGSDAGSPTLAVDPEKDELRRQIEAQAKLISELQAQKDSKRKEKKGSFSPSLVEKFSPRKEISEDDFLPDEEV